MAGNETISSEQQKILVSEKLWLLYFNSYMYEKGVLTEAQRNHIIAKIESRKKSASHKKQKNGNA